MKKITEAHPWGSLSADEARARQDKALKNFVRKKALPHCAHYRRVFRELGLEASDLKSARDLRKLPFTSKADLAAAVTEDRMRDFLILPP